MAQPILDKPQSLESLINSLTPREFETLAFIASGATNKVIAERLGIVESSVSNYITRIFSELEIAEKDEYDPRVKAALLYLERCPEDKETYQKGFFEGLEIGPLAQREYEVLSLVAQGYSNAHIAGKLFVEEKSVENYVNAIYDKLNIRSYEGTSPRVMAMLMFDRVPKPVDEPPSLESRIESMPLHLLNTLSLIASGATNAVIAKRLRVSEKTIDNYTHNIFSELGISNDGMYNPRVKAALMYIGQLTDLRQAGLIDVGQPPFEFFKERFPIEPLKPREYDILSLVAQGYSNAHIAGKLFVEEKSVENYVNAIYKKLNIRSYEGTSPRVMAMLMFDRVPKPEGYKPRETQLVQLAGK